MIHKRLLFSIVSFLAVSFSLVYGETVSGNGYTVEQTFSPIQGAFSGNGYILQSSAQPVGGEFTGVGSQVLSSFGAIATTSTTTSTSTPPSSSPSITISGGYYVFPKVATTTTAFPSSASSSIISQPRGTSTVLTTNGSTCTTRIIFSAPIDIRLNNNKEDVKKLEMFLNTYEGESLVVNGIYEEADVLAVKRWQSKYRSFILDPMRLKNPTGTVYTLSQRQIERQTTKSCGEPIVVTACPFFRTNVKYGDRGDEVKKVQQFLNIVQGEKLPLSGVFGPLTRSAVKRFQTSNRIYVATFIPLHIATGNWYTTTRIKANETIGCDILK